MRGSAGPWLISTWMTSLLATTPYAALHTGTPNPADPTATEVVGAWYARKALTWDSLDSTSCANAAPLKWTGMSAVTLAGVALYTTSTGASMIVWVPYAAPIPVGNGGSLTIAAHDLFIDIA